MFLGGLCRAQKAVGQGSIMATPPPSTPVVMDDDEACVEAAKLLNSHARDTGHEPLGRVLVRSKRAGRHVQAAQRGRAVEVVIESKTKKSKTRCGPATQAASASSPFFCLPSQLTLLVRLRAVSCWLQMAAATQQGAAAAATALAPW